MRTANEGKTKNNEPVLRTGELFPAEANPPSSLLTFNSSFFSPVSPNLSLWEVYHAMGFLRKAHPLALWADRVRAVQARVKALNLRGHIGRFIKMVGWPVTQKDVWTRDGLVMAFLSLEDETGLYETVIFPDVYDRYNKLLFDQQPLLVYGRVMIDEGAVSLEVSRIELLEGALAAS